MLDNNNYVKLSSIHLKQFMSFKEILLEDLEKFKIIFIMSTNATGKSTLTSEALHYALFGRALRFKKLQGLLNNKYVNGEAFAKISLAVNTSSTADKIDFSYLDIRKNIQSEPKFEVEARNDAAGLFDDFTEIRNVDKFTGAIKSMLDLDEKKFSILYLKSPFSESLFESKSTLLASITKVNFFNELRTDFNGIVKDLKKTLELKQGHLNQQSNLLESTKKQLTKYTMDKESEGADVQLITELQTSLAQKHTSIQNEIIRKNKAIGNRDKLNPEIQKLSNLKAQLNTQISHKRTEYKRLQKLIAAGKCPTCEQVISGGIYDNQMKALHEEGQKLVTQVKEVDVQMPELNKRISSIIAFIDETYDTEQAINNHIISLNNQIAQLDSKLKNNTNKQKSDDMVLDQINKAITEIHNEITSLTRDYNILNKIFTKLLNKKGDYINRFYNQKIANFTNVYRELLKDFTNGKYHDVTIDMNNYPIFNGDILYESLSTSERKFVDIAFVISYIAYLSTELKFKTFVLDEFFDNFDQENVLRIYDIIYEIAKKYNLQIFITSNIADYIISNMHQYLETHPDVKIVNLREEIGLDDQNSPTIYDTV